MLNNENGHLDTLHSGMIKTIIANGLLDCKKSEHLLLYLKIFIITKGMCKVIIIVLYIISFSCSKVWTAMNIFQSFYLQSSHHSKNQLNTPLLSNIHLSSFSNGGRVMQ